MIHARPCPECGRPLPPDAREEVCPACALRGLLEFVTPVAKDQSQLSGRGLPAHLDHPPRTQFGDYELLELLARGGMGVVYKARQISLNRTVALKMIQAGVLATPAEVKRFHAEAEAIAQLHHPNIVSVYEIGGNEGQHYFSMDYVAGRTLAEIVRDGPLSAARAATYVQTVAAAVHYAHQHGILHRDLKPANIIIDENDQPRITDFGLAKKLIGTTDYGPQTTELTLSGQVLGSPNYLPPEQAEPKRGTVGPPSDVYALGAILYHLVTGRPPFQAESLTTLLRRVIESDPLAPRLLNPNVPPDLETICLKCLEKEAAHRYPTAQAVAEELGRFLNHEPIRARRIGPGGKLWRWCQRRPKLAIVSSALILSFLLGLTGVLWQWRRAGTQRARAEASEKLAQRNAYAADMTVALRALEDGDLGRVRELLDRHRPVGRSETRDARTGVDLRGWEWRYLWAGSRSEEQFTLERGSNTVTAMAYSSDARWLAVRRIAGTVTLWDTAAKRLVAQFPGAGGPKALAFGPGDDSLAWGSQDEMGAPGVRVLHADERREIAWLPHSAAIVAVAFLPDGRSLATLSESGTVRIWDLSARRIVSELPAAVVMRAAAPDYGCLRVSPNGRVLAVGAKWARIRLWDWTVNTTRDLSPAGFADGVDALAFSPDGNLLAAACGYLDNQIHLWNLQAGTESLLAGHRSWVVDLAFAPDGKTLASASADQTIGLWDIPRTTVRRRLHGSGNEVHALAWSPEGTQLASGGKDGAVRYWDPTPKQATTTYALLSEQIEEWGLAFTPDCRTILTVNPADGSVTCRDASTQREVERLSFLGTNHSGIAMSPDGRLLAVGDRLGHVGVWDFNARRAITNLVLTGTRQQVLEFSARGNVLICQGWVHYEKRTCRLWKVGTWSALDLRGINLAGLSWAELAPDERTLAIVQSGVITWWDLKTERRIACFDAQQLHSIAFSPDGRWFAAGGTGGPLMLWEVATQRSRAIPRSHLNQINGLAFSPDGKRLMTAGTGASDTVKLWDLESGREVATLPGEPGFNDFVGFSPDGNTIFAVGNGPLSRKRTMFWRAPSWAEIESEAQRQVTP
jgi:eukaryotic-like serine/threonine-protein kinase